MSNVIMDSRQDPKLEEGLSRLIHPEIFDQGDVRAWWDNFPKVPHYALDDCFIFDFRYICLSRVEVEGASLSQSCFDGVDARGAVFRRVGFQESTACGADFSGAVFVEAQMSRFFAPSARFSRCRIENSFLQGHHARDLVNRAGKIVRGGFSDFSECDFSDATIVASTLRHCDLRRASVMGAKFERCSFEASDLRGIDLVVGEFVECDFQNAMVDASPNNIAVAKRQLNSHSIAWSPIE